MPTDALSHAREVVAGICFTLGITHVRKEDEAATVEGIARVLARHNNCDPDAMHEGGPLWESWEDEARAALTFILGQAGRDA